MARRERPAVIIFHTVEHARAALAAASELGVPVTLSTAPGAAAYAGPAYLKRLVERALGDHGEAEAHAVIDCGDDAAVALAALRLGWQRVSFRGREEVRARLADIARKLGAEVAAGAPGGLDVLDSADAYADCRAYLARRR